MTPPSAPDADTDRGTVGDILLARGYITDEQLEHAVASQRQTGKPLGQVLVEAGAITRLELASALAEQWSDTETWLGPPAGTPGRESKRKRAPVDDGSSAEAREAGYTQQLQEAVVALARRVALFEPVIADLKLRVEGDEPESAQMVLDRVEVVQDGLAVLSRRIDELTEGTEAALATIQEGSGGLAGEIEALSARLEIAAGTAAIDELRGRVDDLDGRPAGDPELAGAVEVLTSRLDVLADRLDELGETAAGRADAASLDALRAAVDELASTVAGRAESAALAEVRAEVAELAARPQANPGLAQQLEELTARIEALAGTDALEAVRSAVEEIAGRPGADPQVAARIDELAARMDELAAGLEARPEHAALTQVQEALDELSGRIASLADAEALEDLRTSVAEISQRPAIAPELLEQLSELAARIEALATDSGPGDGGDVEAVRAELAELASRTTGDPEVERRVDHVVSRLDALHARIEEVAASVDTGSAVDPELAGSVASISARVEELAAALDAVGDRTSSDELAEVRAQLDGVAARLGAVDEISKRLVRVEEAAAAPPPLDTAALQAELKSSIAEVSDRLAKETAEALERWAAERNALEARLDTLATALADAKTQTLARAVAPTAEPAPRAKTKAKAAPGEETPANVESELERLRMAVERINLNLGERERAIAELMRSRGDVKVEDLAARIAELEQATGAAPKTNAKGGAEPALGGSADMHAELRGLAQRLEETEKLAKADRDKVLTQLERMASSIDWRFRRLETGEENAA